MNGEFIGGIIFALIVALIVYKVRKSKNKNSEAGVGAGAGGNSKRPNLPR